MTRNWTRTILVIKSNIYIPLVSPSNGNNGFWASLATQRLFSENRKIVAANRKSSKFWCDLIYYTFIGNFSSQSYTGFKVANDVTFGHLSAKIHFLKNPSCYIGIFAKKWWQIFGKKFWKKVFQMIPNFFLVIVCSNYVPCFNH